MTEIYYTHNDFQQIINTRNSFFLPNDVMQSINDLEVVISNLVASDTSKPKPASINTGKNYTDKRRYFEKERRMQKDISTEDWQEIRNFKTTKIEIKEGIEKQINNIRILLNKISNKNYDTYKENIFNEIGNFYNSCENDEDREKIIKNIFDIASTNKFYSEIYAELCKELKELFPIFEGDTINNFIDTFTEKINQIHYIDPNVDYDGFCNYTKANDIRKATSTFIINLMIKEILNEKIVTNLLLYMQELIYKYIAENNRTNEVEELTENVFIFVTLGYNIFKNTSDWKNIYDRIIDLSSKKNKDYSSLSNRAIFKHLDILDFFKKQ